MKKTNKILQTVLYVSIAISLLMVILFECGVLECGLYAADMKNEFIAATVMELITICAIPVVLRTFRFGFIKRLVRKGGSGSLQFWSLLRLLILCVLMVVNTLLYYMFMYVAFGYMAIILFLCIFLIYPTMERLKREMEECNK